MLLKLGILVVALGALTGCVSPKAGVTEEEMAMASRKAKNGPWTHIYRGDPDLAGVVVQQFPDGDDGFSFEERNGKHPCMILYGFWNDRFRQMHYTPSGTLESDFWFEVDDSTSWIWRNVDFSHGSDPSFKSHQDPRVRWGIPPD